MTDLPFNGKYVFHHKDGAQCPWLSYSLQKVALFCTYALPIRKNTYYSKFAPWHGRLEGYRQTDKEQLKMHTVHSSLLPSLW